MGVQNKYSSLIPQIMENLTRSLSTCDSLDMQSGKKDGDYLYLQTEVLNTKDWRITTCVRSEQCFSRCIASLLCQPGRT